MTILGASKLVCFAATTIPAKAMEFYQGTLRLSLVADTPFAIVFDANGTMLRIQKVEHFTPAGHTLLGWQVDDLRATIQQLTEKGVRFERYDRLRQDELGIWTTPDGSQVVWFKDPDGNTLSLTQFK